MPAKRGPKRKPAEATTRLVAPQEARGWAPPAHLQGEAKEAWEHVVSLLAQGGNLGRTDPTVVECYAVNFALLREAQRCLGLSKGRTKAKDAGVMEIPQALAVVNSTTMRLKAIVNDLGLCPASSKHAASVVAPPTGDDESRDKWSGLLGIA